MLFVRPVIIGLLPAIVGALLSGCAAQIRSTTGQVVGSSAAVATSTPLSLTVVAAYPLHGADWNDYVLNNGTDTACVGNETPYSACLHAGEIRKVVITGVTSCSGLTLTDHSGVFDWTCSATSGTATFYSALRSTKGLRDLVTAAGWIDNYVTLAGSRTGTSAAAAWWGNPVAVLPINNGTGLSTLNVASTIYVADADRITDGYLIDADKIAVVTLAGTNLSWRDGAAANCSDTTALGPQGAALNVRCTLQSKAHNFYWVEADFDGAAVDSKQNLYLYGSKFIRLYRTTVSEGTVFNTITVWLEGLQSSRITQLTVKNDVSPTWAGLFSGYYVPMDYNYFDTIQIANLNTGAPFRLNGSYNFASNVTIANTPGGTLSVGSYCDPAAQGDHNTFYKLRIFNSGGIFVNSGWANFVDVVSVGNTTDGFFAPNACGWANSLNVVNATFAFNGTTGIRTNSAEGVYNNIVSVGNGTYGLQSIHLNLYGNMAISDSGTKDIRQELSASHYDGNILVGGATSCSTIGGSGVTDTTCVLDGSSTGTLFYQGSILGDFKQALGVNDLTNTSDTLGGATFPAAPATFDWLGFDSFFRTWGVWGTAGNWTAGAGSILDFRLLAGASKILNNSLAVTSSNQAFVSGGPCPSAVHGNRANDSTGVSGVWSGAPAQVYLLNAQEVVDPTSSIYSTTGDHDGLCESNETCIYTPNFGAYQGEGTLNQCTFTDGTVSGVSMYGYSSNGI